MGCDSDNFWGYVDICGRYRGIVREERCREYRARSVTLTARYVLCDDVTKKAVVVVAAQGLVGAVAVRAAEASM